MKKLLALALAVVGVSSALGQVQPVVVRKSDGQIVMDVHVDGTNYVRFADGQLWLSGIQMRIGNAANKIPLIDSGGFLVIGIIPDLPASKITSGTFADARIASAATWNAKENGLGNPSANGYILSSTTAGVRTWIVPPNGISTATPPLSYNTGTHTLSISQATGSTDGYLSSGDWTTFNNKQNAITTGTTAQYFRGDLSLATLNKAAVAGLHDNDDVFFGYVQSTGTSAGFLFSERNATGADWIGYATSGIFRLYNGSDRLTLSATGNLNVTGTVTGSNLSNTNSGDVTLSGENYLSIAGQVVTVGAVDLSGTNATGTLAAARAPGFTGGDVTSSAGSLALTIGSGTVTLAKMANVATGTVFYRKTAGTGAPEVQTLSTLKTDMSLNLVENTALSTWAGTTSITTLGTIGTGTWQGGVIGATYGGTGVNNGSKMITLGASFATTGTSITTLAFPSSGTPTYTFPAASQTIASLAGTEALTNKDLTGAGNTFPTFNQNTTGSAAKWTTARLLAGNSVDGSANVAFANKFIVQGTTDTGLSAAQFLGALATGIVKNTTTTGVLSIAVAGDFPTLNQNTTGSAATLTTARGIGSASFNGSADITLDTIENGLSSNGFIARTGANTRATRTLTGTANQISITNTAGVLGDPVFSIPSSAQLSIAKLTNLTSNGFVKTSASDGTLSIDTSTYLTGNQSISISGDATGSGTTSIALTVTKINGTSLAGLATGILKNATTTGVPSIAVAADFPTLNQNTTGSAATLTTARNIGSASFNGSANISIDSILNLASTGIIARTAANTLTPRTITGTTNQITVTNGDGVSGAPTISVPSSSQLSIAKITNLTTNGFVKTGSSDGTLSVASLVAGDIPSTLNGTTFSANVTMTPSSNNGLTLGPPGSAMSTSLRLLTYADSASGRNWALRNRYNAQGTLELMRSTDNSSDPLTPVATYFGTGGVYFGDTVSPTDPGANNVKVQGNLTIGGTFSPPDYDIGVAASYSANVVLLGDSLHQQLGGINSYYGTGSIPALGSYNGIAVSPAQGQNVAVAGTTVQYWRDNAGTLNATYRREAGMNIAVPLIGTNTLTTKTAKEVYSEIEALCRHLRATGWRVVLVGLLSRGGSNANGTYDSQVATVNGYIRQNWAQFADRFIDWGIINSGSNEFNTGGYSNTTYYTGDQLHQQVAGAQKLAGYEVAAINDLLTYYFQTHRNQFMVNMNKASHDNVAANGMLTLRNENPSAGQSEINFSFYNGTSYALKENIRGGYDGVLNYGATVGHIFYAGSTGPDVYGTTGSDGPPAVLAISNTSVVSYKGFSVTGAVSYSSGTPGLYFGHDGTTGIITSTNPAVAGKALEIYGYPTRFYSSNSGNIRFTVDDSGINLGASLNYSASGASVIRVSDNSNNVLNPVTNSGAIYLNWDRGTAGIGTIFGNGGGTTVARLSLAGGFFVGGSGDPGAGNIYAGNHITSNAQSANMGYPLWSGDYSNDRAMKIAGGYRTSGMRITANNNADTALVPLEILGSFIHINQGGLIVGDWTSGATNPGDGNINIGAASAKAGTIYFGNDRTRYLQYLNLSGTEYYNFNDTPTVAAQAYLTRSSRTLKANIKDWDGDVKTKRRRLHPRSFELKGAPGKERIGFVAEEIAETLPEAMSYVPSPDPGSPPVPGYDATVIVAKHEIELQDALDKIEELEAAVAALQGKAAPKRRPEAEKTALPTPPPAPAPTPPTTPPTPAPARSPIISVSPIPVETPRPSPTATLSPSPTPTPTVKATPAKAAAPKPSPTPKKTGSR